MEQKLKFKQFKLSWNWVIEQSFPVSIRESTDKTRGPGLEYKLRAVHIEINSDIH